VSGQQDPEVSESGVWFDSKAGKVVNSAPEEGVQLVPPGGELTAAVKAAIDRHESIAPVVEPAAADPNLQPEGEVETADEPPAEVSEAVADKPKKAAAKKAAPRGK
jgi:hypothetical protein